MKQPPLYIFYDAPLFRVIWLAFFLLFFLDICIGVFVKKKQKITSARNGRRFRLQSTSQYGKILGKMLGSIKASANYVLNSPIIQKGRLKNFRRPIEP